MIRAILRAQWLSMRFSRLGAGRRSAAITIVLAIVWYGFWTLVAVMAAFFAASPTLRAQIETWLPVALLGVFLYWQLMPVASANMGASLDLRKLLLYPVPRGSLFLVEILLRLTTCIELLLVLAGLGVGLLRNPAFGGWRLLARVPPGMVLFAAFNLTLSAGLRSLIERLLSRRGIREIVALLMMILAVLPRLLMVTGARLHRLEPLLPAARTLIWPWAAASQFMLASPAAGATLAAWTAAGLLFGRWQFMRSLRFDMQAAQAARTPAKDQAWTDRLYRLPSLFLPDPLAAMVEKELRSLARTPRFRMVFVMGFSFGVIVWLPSAMHRGAHLNVSSYFLPLVSLYALTLLGQVTYWNAFGFDASAAQIYFLAPVSIRRSLTGKNIAAALFIFLEIGAVSLACWLLRVGISAGKIAEAFLVSGIAALYLLGIGNLGSVNYPRAMSVLRVSAGGARGRTQGLVFILYPVALLPIILAYVARYAFDSQTVFYASLAGATVLGAGIYYMATESAAATARTRRETILAGLSRGEGPMVVE